MTDTRVTQVLCSDLDSCNIVQGNTVRRILVPFDNSPHSNPFIWNSIRYGKKIEAHLL